jgi:hypothetical protein
MSIFYIIFFAYVAFKSWNSKKLLLIILTAPFGLSFVLNDWSSFGYKDIILLINFIIAYKIQKIEGVEFRSILLIINVIFGALVHENYLFLSVPFILLSNEIEYYKCTQSRRFNTSLISWIRRNIVLISTSLILCLLIYIANHFVSIDIIRSLKRENILVLSDVKKTNINLKLVLAPLDWLLQDVHYGIEMTKSNYTNLIIGRISFLHIILLFIYIYIVIEISLGFDFVKSKILDFRFSIAVIFIGYIFIFYIATDWGRWMFLFFMHFSCLIIQNKENLNNVFISNIILKKNKYFVFLIFIITYFIRVPHYYSISSIKSGQTFSNIIFQFISSNL